MSKYNPIPVGSVFNVNAINENNKKIAEILNDEVLFRKNPVGEPNEMKNNLDMNSYRIYNLPEPVLEHEAARKGDMDKTIATANEILSKTEAERMLAELAKREAQLAAANAKNSEVATNKNIEVSVAILQAAAKNSFYHYKTRAEAQAASIPDNSFVQVFRDETMENSNIIYKKEGGVLVFQADLDSLRKDLSDGTVGARIVKLTLSTPGAKEVSLADLHKNSVSLSQFEDGGDPFNAFKSAVEYLKSVGGGSLYIPPGHYKTIPRPYTDPESWVEIDFSGFRMWANPGTVTFENFLIYVHGEYGAPVNIGSETIFSGTNKVTTESAIDLAYGDGIQILSQLNPYTPDSGEWQMGSKNPTTLETPDCRFSEIKTVSEVVNGQEFFVSEPFLYSGYKNNTAGQSYPLAGVTSAEIRKIDFLEGLIFYGINFKNVEISSFRGILFRAVRNSFFIECGWEAGTQPGRHFACTDSSNIGFVRTSSFRNPLNPTGSSWNSFIIGGGSERVYFENVNLTGEAQAVDVTPNMLANDPGATVTDIRSGYLTTQHVSIVDSLGRGCGDMFTSHPATYGINVINCDAIGGSTGFRIRSRGSKIIGCRTKTHSGGLSLSAYHDDTIVANNFFENQGGTQWTGLSVAPLSSEIMNSNNTKNVRFFGNTYKDEVKAPGNAGLLFRMAGNGEPANPGFDLFTDTIKAAMSGYYVSDEYFSGCSLVSGRFINGLFVESCSFGDGTGRSDYIVAKNGTATHTYDKIEVRDLLKNSASLGRHWSGLPYPVNPGHRIGSFTCWAGSPIITHESDRGGTVNLGNLSFSGASFSNGTGVKSVRATGPCTLRLDSVPLDGSSAAIINVFGQSTTTGDKTLSVGGRVESHNSYPAQTNAYTSGLPSRAWAGGFTQSAFTVTSDERHKVHQPIGDAVLRAWAKVEYCQFKFKDRIEQKGDGARWHFGLLAQQVKAAFESEGLDAFEYGLLCFDEWDELPEIKDEDGNIIQEHRAAGDKYGIRYEEALALECAYLRNLLKSR